MYFKNKTDKMKRSKVYSWILAFAVVSFAACNSGTNSSNDNAVSNGWKAGLALYSFNTLSFKDAFEKVDSGKIKYIEGFSFYKLGKEYNDITMGDLSKEQVAGMKELMKEKSVTMPSMYVGGGNNVEEWKKTFEMAKEFGLEFITCEPQKAHLAMIDSLAGIYNIKVAIHNHWKEISAYWHPDSVLAVTGKYPHFGALADLGHWVRSGLDPAKCLAMLKGHILGIHLKDVDKSGDAKANDVKVGTGVIDFKTVIAELKRQDYKAYVYVECEHNFGTNLPEIVETITYFDTLTGK